MSPPRRPCAWWRPCRSRRPCAPRPTRRGAKALAGRSPAIQPRRGRSPLLVDHRDGVDVWKLGGWLRERQLTEWRQRAGTVRGRLTDRVIVIAVELGPARV